jgi:hypothetical protein
MKPQRKLDLSKTEHSNQAPDEFLTFEEDWLEVSDPDLPNEIRKEFLSY